MENKALKKAGIIVGFTIIAIAIAIWCFANSIIKSKDKPKENKVEISNTHSIQDKNNTSNNNNNKGNSNNSKHNTTIEETPAINSSNSVNVSDEGYVANNITDASAGTFAVVDSSSLGNPIAKEDLMLVASKRLFVIDKSQNNGIEMQLQYVVDLVTTDNSKLSIYVNGVAYEAINVGDKLVVTYKVYKNDNGVEFPLVMDAKALQ